MTRLSQRAAQERLNQLRPLAPLTTTTTSGIRIHALQTGALVLKAAHRAYRGLPALALPAILLDQIWTEPLPMLAWIIEHPEGLVLIDTGERAAVSAHATYLACDPNLAWFVGQNFRLYVQPEEELVAQMATLGLDPAAVRWILQTHLHFDHVGGLGAFPQAQVLVAQSEFQHPPRGAAVCLWPAWYRPTEVVYRQEPLGAFAARHTLTRAGDLHLVPTPGHTAGHQSVVLEDGDGATCWCFAGDVAFSERQIWRGEIAGIAHDRAQSAATNRVLAQFLRERPTIFLPSHDPEARARFAARQIATPPSQ